MSKERILAWLKTPKANALLVGIVLFAIYAYHVAPGVTAEDSGDFLLGAQTLGVVHPPGYPLYTILSFFATKVPLIHSAMAVNLLSGLCAAIAASFLFLMITA